MGEKTEKKTPDKLLGLIREFSKLAKYKTKIQKLIEVSIKE